MGAAHITDKVSMLIIMLVLAHRWFSLHADHLQMLFIFTKRLKVSMICGSQNMNIMRYDITFGFGSL